MSTTHLTRPQRVPSAPDSGTRAPCSAPLALALLVVAMLLVALTVALLAILAAPYLLVRYVRARRAERAVAIAGAPAAPLVSVRPARVAA